MLSLTRLSVFGVAVVVALLVLLLLLLLLFLVPGGGGGGWNEIVSFVALCFGGADTWNR